MQMKRERSLSWSRIRRLGPALLLAAGAIFGGAACDAVDSAFDCQAACSKYKDCFQTDYNVGQCRDNCRQQASNDDSFRHKADVCEACIDGQSCAAATFSCTADCAGIVP